MAHVLQGQRFKNHHSGLLIIDPSTEDTIVNYNAQAYFTPASNVKIFTLFATLTRLPPRVPAAKYKLEGDTLWIVGTGNPAFLHPKFRDSALLDFLRPFRLIKWFHGNFGEGRFAPGWAWEDFPYYFSPERSSLPLYGNALQIIGSGSSAAVLPAFFKDSIFPPQSGPRRDEFANRFFLHPKMGDTITIPMRITPELIASLLIREGAGGLQLAANLPQGPYNTIYGYSRDSIAIEMMVESDNFLAEQLMLMVSSTFSDTLSFNRARDTVLSNELKELPTKPRWVDGSGLSRYNLFTPASLVYVLDKLYRDQGQERIFSFFPKGGVNGTLEDWFGTSGTPYLVAKTGTLGNTYCVSGYLITDRGRVLIFSFMNNHFLIPRREVQIEMQKIFETLKTQL